MTVEQFQSLIGQITTRIDGRLLDPPLADDLNRTFPFDGDIVGAIEAACRAGEQAGWICEREGGGIRFGRPVKAGPETHGFSVDVVRMRDVRGPHHRHPLGEIDLVMPITPGARFDGHAAGWCVYPPDSAHYPTVTQGEAYVLYLLPEGRIEFTRH